MLYSLLAGHLKKCNFKTGKEGGCRKEEDCFLPSVYSMDQTLLGNRRLVTRVVLKWQLTLGKIFCVNLAISRHKNMQCRVIKYMYCTGILNFHMFTKLNTWARPRNKTNRKKDRIRSYQVLLNGQGPQQSPVLGHLLEQGQEPEQSPVQGQGPEQGPPQSSELGQG